VDSCPILAWTQSLDDYITAGERLDKPLNTACSEEMYVWNVMDLSQKIYISQEGDWTSPTSIGLLNPPNEL